MREALLVKGFFFGVLEYTMSNGFAIGILYNLEHGIINYNYYGLEDSE